MPRVRGHTEDGQEIRAPAQVDVLGEHAGNVETASQNVPDDVDGKLREDKDDAQEEGGRTTSGSVLVLDRHEQGARIPKRCPIAVFWKHGLAISSPSSLKNTVDLRFWVAAVTMTPMIAIKELVIIKEKA